MAALIPREAWDPAHHNPKWVDSYADPVASRREWPGRQWIVGLNPKTPKEFLSHSMRNLAYEYNASLRACSSFPEMLSFYKEMMVRGVKMDVDTMYVILSRAARFPGITPEQIFSLWDEMLMHGARPDFATTEVLQTVITVLEDEHGMKPFHTLRKRQLIDTYSILCCKEMHRLGSRGHYSLMQQIFHRCRDNVAALQSMLSFDCYSIYISYIIKDSGRLDTLSFSRNAIDKADTKFLESIATLYTAEGVLLALRYDLQKVLGFSGHAVELKTTAQDGNSHKIYSHSLKRAFLSGDESATNAQKGVAAVYMCSLQSAIYRYGTSDPIEEKRLLYFCRLIWLDISLNGLTVGASSLIELLMEVYKYYGKAQAARKVMEYSLKNRILTARALAHYIACIDPWAEKSGTLLPHSWRGRAMAHKTSPAHTQPDKEIQPNDGSTTSEIYTAKALESRFNEVKNYAFDSLVSGSVSFDQTDSFQIPIALLWFLRRAVNSVLSQSTSDKDVLLESYKCLQTVHNVLQVLVSNGGRVDQSILQRELLDTSLRSTSTKLYTFSNVPSDIAGDYTENFLYLLENIALNIDSEHVNKLMLLRKEFISCIQNDNRLLMGWLEEQ